MLATLSQSTVAGLGLGGGDTFGWSVAALGDVDGDGDVDALSASYVDDTIAWYENADGAGGSWTYHVISTAADWAHSVFAIDVDGDNSKNERDDKKQRNEPKANTTHREVDL